jgi:hypothetical protein
MFVILRLKSRHPFVGLKIHRSRRRVLRTCLRNKERWRNLRREWCSNMKQDSFFRWMPAAIILWVFAVIFALAAGWSVSLARQAARGHTDSYFASTLALIGDSQHTTRWFMRGAMADASVAALCILGWYLMRRRLSVTLALGAMAVMCAAFIVGKRSLIYLFDGAGIVNWFDLVLELPLLFYAIIYAYRECRIKSQTSK